jgi:hypothetical protein
MCVDSTGVYIGGERLATKVKNVEKVMRSMIEIHGRVSEGNGDKASE